MDFDTFTVLTWNSLSLAGDKEAKGITDHGQPSATPPPALCQPGSLSHLAEKLSAEGITVACIQESRLSLPEDFSTS
eukprot:4774765-Amphidinium_carterae.1